MKRTIILLSIILTATNLTGCEVLRTSRENNVMGKLTTTVFDDRNSFEDLEINEKIDTEVEIKEGDTSKKDYSLWKKIKNHLINLKWR